MALCVAKAFESALSVNLVRKKRNRDKEDALESRIDQATAQQSISSPRLALSSGREAVTNLFVTERRRLYYAALRLLGNAEDAEDAMQEGLLAALRNVHRFEGRARLSTWLTRIVVNAALMRLRTLHTHESESIDELIIQRGRAPFSDMLVDNSPDPEQLCLRTEQRQILYQGLKGLCYPQRRALSLRDLQGMTFKETALMLGMAEGTVKSQVHRARRRLSEHIRRTQQPPALPKFAQA
jgi:RNA polymerase sigma-70 factor, ECF subfamily